MTCMNDEKNTKGKNAQLEEQVLEFWNKNRIFEKSIEKPAGEENPQEFVFYDGPPFATGLPHYGHLLQSFVKDAIPRYKTMRGFRVERQWGWDCHGLPIENLVEKELGVSGRDEIIEKVGVKKFNQTCRQKIFEFEEEWKKIIPRIGRWADMDNPYKTMDKDYMESEWWAFKTLYEKGLVYEDFRSIHICPRCETTLSQSEVTEGYAEIKDISVTAKFELEDEPGTYILAWTTTPWTLPGNVALAVGENIDYVRVESEGEQYILAKERLEDIFKDKEYKILEEFKGKELEGRSYKPAFNYYKDKDLENKENIWKVYTADFVSTEEGTGIVHIAPAFGAEDMQLAKEKKLPFIQHVDITGRFKKEVKDFAGMQVKPKDDHQRTDIEIIKYLAHKGLLFAKQKIEHSYPHCWRCDTPLLNYATSSWFVAVEKIKSDLLKNAEPIYWYPHHIKKGRWGNWLEGAKDWSISRNRFWANTIPVWRCSGKPAQNNADLTRNYAENNGCGNEVVVGSIDELEKYSSTRVDDLHKDVVDDVTWKCEKCGGTMKRIPDVLDTWFNSGSVPYATYHYPFENQEKFEKRNPADFIAEGQDQTRAWFYYQHVLATALFNRNAFKNVITTGIVLAEDGKKMSKKLKNYPDPMYMVDTYGADAIRLYMLGSPAVKADNLAFSEKEVAEISRKTLGRLLNVLEFYKLYEKDLTHLDSKESDNVLDKWIINKLYDTHKKVTDALEEYALDKAVKPLHGFVDDLSTWYLRRSRERFKGEDENAKLEALESLRFVLRKTAKLLAPLAPFHADYLWFNTKRESDPESVHLSNWCSIKQPDETILQKMKTAREIVTLALDLRKTSGIKVRQPLSTLFVSSKLASSLDDDYFEIIADEVNVKKIEVKEIESVELDTNITEELKKEGLARDILRAIQQKRKELQLTVDDFVSAKLKVNQEMKEAIDDFEDMIKKNALLTKIDIEVSETDYVEVQIISA